MRSISAKVLVIGVVVVLAFFVTQYVLMNTTVYNTIMERKRMKQNTWLRRSTAFWREHTRWNRKENSQESRHRTWQSPS